MQIWQKVEIFLIKDGGRTPYWKSFLAISRRYIGRFMQISEWGWRITCIYRSLEQNGNFRKFKMADGRHFENSFISMSQNYPISIKFDLPMQISIPRMAISEKSKFFKFKMADGRHIENRVLAIVRRLIGRLMWNSEWRWRITCIEVTWPKMEIFPNSIWRTAAILKPVFGVYVILVMN